MAVRYVIAALVFALHGTSLAGTTLEIAGGETKFRAREDGTWWQSQYETHNDLRSKSWRIAVRDRFEGSHYFGWSVGYSDLGKFSGNNHATIWDEEAGRIPEDGSQCHPENFSHGCMAWYRGHGKAKGLTFGLTADHSLGGFRVGVEGGLFLFRSSYDVMINFPQGFMPVYFTRADGVIVPQIHPDVAPGGSLQYNHATGTHWTPYYGFRIGYGPLFAQMLVFNNVYEQGNNAGGDVGLTGGRARQILIGIEVKI